MAETPAGWLPPRITGAVVVVADWVVVGSVVVVVGSVVVVVGPVVVGSAVVVVSSVVVGSVVVLEAVVVVEAAVVVGSVAVLGVVTGSWLVAPGVACVLVAVVSLQPGASAVGSRPPVVIGRLVADGLVSGMLVGGEGVVVGSVVLVVKDVGAGSVVMVGRATPGARRGGSGWGSRVAEATRAARTAVANPKATSSSLQGRRALARCRGDGVGICIVPV
jgi:NDP-sugar pyrophosphorylase family protein